MDETLTMSDIVIKAEGLGKKYLIGHQTDRERYTALRDILARNVRDYWRKAKALVHGEQIVQGDEQEEIWALRDVSFEIRQGETVGIIGRNGAGKSTLLKILSRITEPSTGRVTIKGRVASLLEVGTGFHPELTGRENIYLNGAILGMTRREIKRKFDEIVDFAEVEKFLDTPVKRYSSGMYVRLAFAVAAHLEPEILVVDEVLAVGDAAFQKKCLGKMGDVAKGGRTVLFVSHNIAAINNLCGRGIYLSAGMLYGIDHVENIVKIYLKNLLINTADEKLYERKDRKGSGVARFYSVNILDSENCQIANVLCGQNVKICIKISSRIRGLILKNPFISIGINNSIGYRVWHLSNESTGQYFSNFNVDNDFFKIEVPKFPLVADAYNMVLFLSSNGTIVDWIENAANFNVESGDFYNTVKLPPIGQGVFLAEYSVGVILNHV